VVKGTLGQGGMGVVLEAKHPSLPIDVAVKVLRGDSLDDDALARFRGEVLALTKVQHPNVVPILDAGRANDGSPYYVMPKITGRSLLELLKTDGPFEPRRAATLTAKLARALHHVHVDAAVVHRDLKPSNVLIEDVTGEPKLFDFGLAKSTGKSSHLTQSGIVVGTPDYMAPEQAQGTTKEADARTDVYGLGALLFSLLTGRPPLEARGRDIPTVLREAASLERPSPASVRPDLPDELVAICRRALALERHDRYGTALELAIALERFLKRGGAAAPRPGPRVSPSAVVAVLAALFVGVGAAAAFYVRSEQARELADGAIAELAKEKASSKTLQADLDRLRRSEKARSLLREARALVEQGACAPATGKPHELALLARDKLKEARREAESEEGLVEAGRLLFRAALYADARETLEHAVATFPESWDALEVLHHVTHAERSPCDALRARVKALAQKRREPALHALVCELETASLAGDEKAQVKLLNDPLWSARPTAFSEILRGNFLVVRAGLLDDALVAFTTALELLPGDPEALARRADCYCRLGSMVLAQRDADAALERDPTRPLAHFTKARVAIAFGENNAAITACDSALREEPRDAGTWGLRAQACILANRFDEGLANAEQSISAGRSPTAHLVRALVVATRNRGQEALQEIDEGLKIDSTLSWAYSLRSAILFHMGHPDLARNACITAVEWIHYRAQDREPQTMLALIEACSLIGEAEGARKWAREIKNLYATWGREVPQGIESMIQKLGGY
ncbi:protein kinase, partial [bacterium]|nr:protein kinase [bacterium]